MTNAENTPPELLAERFGAAPGVGARARFIATLHALAAYAADLPAAAFPRAATISFGVPDVATLREVAAALGEAGSLYPPEPETPRQLTIFRPFGYDVPREFYTPITVSIPKPDSPL